MHGMEVCRSNWHATANQWKRRDFARTGRQTAADSGTAGRQVGYLRPRVGQFVRGAVPGTCGSEPRNAAMSANSWPVRSGQGTSRRSFWR